MQGIEPLIVQNDKGAYSAYVNDVRLFLRKIFEKSGESKRIVADKVCEYILKENTNVALKHPFSYNLEFDDRITLVGGDSGTGKTFLYRL